MTQDANTLQWPLRTTARSTRIVWRAGWRSPFCFEKPVDMDLIYGLYRQLSSHHLARLAGMTQTGLRQG